MKQITTIAGDGIGIEVLNESIKVLDALNLNFNYDMQKAGFKCFNETGTTIPEETIKSGKKSKATLFGAITSTPGEKSPIITLRKELDVYGNIRPIKTYPGVKAIKDNIDFIIIRENTEGLYSQVEEIIEENNKAIAKRIITKKASERICKLGFEKAKEEKREKVTCVHKANVLKKTDGVFKDSFYKIAKNYENLKVNDYYVDATAMYLITQPENFDVIITTNLFGDILSDEGAGIVGGLGLAPSGNIGDKHGLFEPVHGSAPDIAGKNISNPIAMVLSAGMMLNYLGYKEEGKLVENACNEVLKERKILTPDLGGKYKTQDVGDEIIKKMKL